MSIALITPPTAEPITVAQLMQQMGFGTVADGTLEAVLDAQLTTAAVAARHNIESFLRRALITQHWLLRRDCFTHRGIDLPKPPFQSVDWFRYVDTGANVQPLLLDTTYGQNFPAPYGYQLERGSETQSASLYPPWSKPWPPTLRVPSSVMVQFRCGYGGPVMVNMTLGSAILSVQDGTIFNPDDAPLMTGDTGLKISVPGAGSQGLNGPPLTTNVASVDINGQATLAATATTAVTNVQAWAGHPVPPDIIKAILLLSQFYYEQSSVGGEIPSYVMDSIWAYRNLVS
jgi:uncharacterized phiE125 gp8 family phage protein